MHRPLTQKLQFNGERDLGYTFAVAEWNVFENTGGKATSRGPAISPRRPSVKRMMAYFLFAIMHLQTSWARARKFTL